MTSVGKHNARTAVHARVALPVRERARREGGRVTGGHAAKGGICNTPLHEYENVE
jgi:hypothetical protein